MKCLMAEFPLGLGFFVYFSIVQFVSHSYALENYYCTSHYLGDLNHAELWMNVINLLHVQLAIQ